MSEDRQVIRTIAWRDVFPWLILVRIFRLSVSGTLLLPAAIALLVTPLGWHAADYLLVDADRQVQTTSESSELDSFQRVRGRNLQYPGQHPSAASGDWGQHAHVGADSAAPTEVTQQALDKLALDKLADPFRQLLAPVDQLTAPARGLFGAHNTLSRLGYYLVGGLWTLLVWSFFGGTITRLAVVRLGRDERLGLLDSAAFAMRRLPSYFAAPLLPMLGLLVFGLTTWPVGLLMRTDVGVLLGGLVWIVVLVGALLLGVLLLGLLFGWPLMWGTISSEEMGDVFEANQRSYSYTLERPLHYLFYALIAALLFVPGWYLVHYFSESVIWLAHWVIALPWSAGSERVEGLSELAQSSQGGWMLQSGQWLIELSDRLVRTLADGFAYSYFWCAAAAIYLLLRHDVDRTELDEVYLDEQFEAYAMPEADSPNAAESGDAP